MKTIKRLSPKIIGLAILLWLFFNVDLSRTVAIISKSSPALLGAALVLMFIHVLIKFFRFQYILVQQDIKNPFFETIRFSLASLYLSFITPGRVGEVSKAYFIHKAHGIPLNKPAAGAIVDRIFDVYTLLLLSLLGLTLFAPTDMETAPLIVAILIVAVTPFLLLTSTAREWFIGVVGFIQNKVNGSSTWCEHLRGFFSEIDFLLNRKLVVGFIATFVAYAFFFTTCYFLVLSLGIELSFYKVVIFITFANILSFLPITFAGLGTREAALVFLFSTESLSSESALAFSALVFSYTYLLFGILGFFAYMTLKRDKGSLKKDA